MSGKQTETVHEAAGGLDIRPRAEVALLLAEGQIKAATSLRAAVQEIVAGAAIMARTLRQGGVVHYVAAGSSGLMAAADAQELGGTFSVPAEQLRIHMAGGLPTGVDMPGDTEDDTTKIKAAMSAVTDRDTIIAVSASGATPFTLTAAQTAKDQGAKIIGIANNARTPLLECADVAICLATPPEILAGSTRMGAGTAQKIALNMLSTLMAIELGHVYDGMMVNLRADNIKLRARAAAIVQRIAGACAETAAQALDAAKGEVKPAVLIARSGVSPEQAHSILRATEGNLRAALARLD